MYNSIPPKLLLQLQAAPKRPGVYMFRNDCETILYVGKAVNLFNRSHSYFANYNRLDPRLRSMVEAASSIEYLEVENEVEALLLETNLIKKYDPKYNILMTDDKSYIWVKVYSQLDFPIVRIVRNKLNDNADYFGPFPAKTPVKRLLQDLRKIFPYRTCNRKIVEVNLTPEQTKINSSDKKPCFYYDLGLCSAPCTTQQSKADYRLIINNLKRFLRSEHQELKAGLLKQMKELAKIRKYEDAAGVRDKLKDIEYVTQFSRVNEEVDDIVLDKKNSDAASFGLIELLTKTNLPVPDATKLINYRIECYDISNIQGSNAVAAMVVMIGGKISKQNYRKFKIMTKQTPDDFAMLEEVLARRLKHLIKPVDNTSEKVKTDQSLDTIPDLIVVDGGKGQLSSMMKILEQYYPILGYKIPVIGLAKKFEEIILPDKFKTLRLNRRSDALRLLQQIRDEAHRFGIGYHRLLRSKGMIYSELDLVPGVGEVIKKKLILAFGNVDNIKKAKLEEIESVVKNRNTAQKIKKLLL